MKQKVAAKALKGAVKRAVGKAHDLQLVLIEKLIDARKKANLTQVELAKRLKVHQPSIARLERGAAGTSAKRLAEYAEAVGQTLTLVPKKPIKASRNQSV
jgi:transcriptional regulator with XRE-family HTH domain